MQSDAFRAKTITPIARDLIDGVDTSVRKIPGEREWLGEGNRIVEDTESLEAEGFPLIQHVRLAAGKMQLGWQRLAMKGRARGTPPNVCRR